MSAPSEAPPACDLSSLPFVVRYGVEVRPSRATRLGESRRISAHLGASQRFSAHLGLQVLLSRGAMTAAEVTPELVRRLRGTDAAVAQSSLRVMASKDFDRLARGGGGEIGGDDARVREIRRASLLTTSGEGEGEAATQRRSCSSGAAGSRGGGCGAGGVERAGRLGTGRAGEGRRRERRAAARCGDWS